MTIFALVNPKNEVVQRASNIDPSVQTKSGFRWLPVVVTGDDDFDGEAQTKSGPVVTVEADRVVESYTVKGLTAEEIDARKVRKVDTFTTIKVLFNLHNRVRALEGQPAHTLAQFKTALRAIL